MVGAAPTAARIAVATILHEQTPLQQFFQVQSVLKVLWMSRLEVSSQKFACATFESTQLTAGGQLQTQLSLLVQERGPAILQERFHAFDKCQKRIRRQSLQLWSVSTFMFNPQQFKLKVQSANMFDVELWST